MVCMCQPLSFECAPGDCIIGRRGEEEGYCVGQGKFDIQRGGGDQRGGWPLAGILPKLVRVLDR